MSLPDPSPRALDAPASPIVTAGDLPPTQHLVMEVLAARHRLGEPSWQFPQTCRKAMAALVAADLVDVIKDHDTVGQISVRLTDKGRSEWLYSGYEPPSPTAIYRFDVWEPYVAGAPNCAPGTRPFGCTAVSCHSPAEGVRERGEGEWHGTASCEHHADAALWKALTAHDPIEVPR